MELIEGIQPVVQGIAFVLELSDAHRLCLVLETHAVGLLETVVFQRNHQVLAAEVDVLQGQGRVGVAYRIGFLVVRPIEKGEGQIVFGLGDLNERGVGEGDRGVGLVVGMVVNSDSVEHLALLVLVHHPYRVSFYAVVEYARRYLDFVLGIEYVVAQGIDFRPGLRHQPVTHEKCTDCDYGADHGQRSHHAGEGNSGSLHCKEFLVLGHLAYDHHRG